MLHEFLTANREELIRRCRSKVRKRSSPPGTPAEVEHGVPLFLEQLVAALRSEQEMPAPRRDSEPSQAGRSPAAMENSRTAALHGRELLALGYSVDQVVHGYGDICQSITELARETSAPITVDEFHTFNRMLDSAIADAVSSHGERRDTPPSREGDHVLHDQLGILAETHRKYLETAMKALDALKVGNVGVRGATGKVLEDSLQKMQELLDRSLPEIRLGSGMTRTPSGR